MRHATILETEGFLVFPINVSSLGKTETSTKALQEEMDKNIINFNAVMNERVVFIANEAVGSSEGT